MHRSALPLLSVLAAAALSASFLPASADGAYPYRWTMAPGVNMPGMTGIETVGRIPGDVRNTNITPLWPAESFARLGEQPYTDGSIALYASNGSDWNFIPNNEFFGPGQYGTDCGSLTIGASYNLLTGIGGFTAAPDYKYCRVTAAPVVDMDWVRANLDAKGYTYAISYPQTNQGNSRALISWVKACMYPNWQGNVFPTFCWHGMARLEGAPEGWTDQYTGGAAVLGQISALAAPTRSTTAAIFKWTSGVWYGFASMMQPMMPSVVPVQDDWLAGTPTPPAPPPLPPLPPVVAGAPAAGSINYGTPGSTGSGVGGSLDGDGRSVVTFDYAAFCNKPGSDGQARSAGFVSACMAGAR